MGTTSEHTWFLPSDMSVIGARLHAFMKERNYIQRKMAGEWIKAARELDLHGAAKLRLNSVRTRIAKIVACRKALRPRAKGAKALTPNDFRILTHLGVPLDDLLPKDSVLICWDALSNQHSAQMFYQRMAAELNEAAEMVSWAEFLPCSLETKAFMEAHHASIFSELYDDYPDEYQVVVDKFNIIGNHRRDAFTQAGHSRPWRFTHIMFESDLARIADLMADEYCRCRPATRRACLRNLKKLIEHREWRIDLIVVEEASAQKLKKKFSDYDSIVLLLNGEGQPTYTFRRTHNGDVSCSKQLEDLNDRMKRLAELRSLAKYNSAENPDPVVGLLDDLMSRLPR